MVIGSGVPWSVIKLAKHRPGFMHLCVITHGVDVSNILRPTVGTHTSVPFTNYLVIIFFHVCWLISVWRKRGTQEVNRRVNSALYVFNTSSIVIMCRWLLWYTIITMCFTKKWVMSSSDGQYFTNRYLITDTKVHCQSPLVIKGKICGLICRAGMSNLFEWRAYIIIDHFKK